MTHTIELPPAVESAITVKAQRRGVSVEKYLGELAERDASEPDAPAVNGNASASGAQSTLGARLAAIATLPTCETRKGLAELDLSGARADVYGYSERENSQL